MIPTPEFDDDAQKYRLTAVLIALVAGISVYLLSVRVFPHHSTNHDEAVYLQQAAMLLEGQLFLRPPVPESFRPWFFVRDGARLYSKYSPVAPALFAAGKLLGGYRIALAGIAAGNAALTYAVGAEVFDRRTGLLATILLVASPLFLVDSAVFLPYAPTTLLNLLFAFAYLRSHRIARGSRRDRRERGNGGDGGGGNRSGGYPTPALRRWAARRWAGLAGVAVGLAFFARPYTAVLFAAPFLVHALWTLRGLDGGPVVRQSITAALGLAGVAVTLGYNALTTGDPLVFPYQAFAPLDGLGFGHREILGYDRDYTPALALRANAEVLRRLFGRWVVAGALGTALAAVGVGAWIRRDWRRGSSRPDGGLPARLRAIDGRRAVLAGLFLSIPAGNVLFWGNLNILGDLAVPDDGLVVSLGTYYHFDLLVPTAVFGAYGALALAGRWRGVVAGIRERTGRFDTRHARALFLAGLLVGAAVLAGANAAAVDRPIDRNRGATAQLDRAYEPFEGRAFENALVLLPTPYGDWLNHPFQKLRNDPGYDGPAVYALRERQFAVLDAFPDRRVYRYVYRGEWAPAEGSTVDARLQRIRQVRGRSVRLDAGLGIPRGAAGVSVRLATDRGSERYAVERVATGTGPALPGSLNLTLTVADGRVRVDGPLVPARVGGEVNRSVPVEDRDRVVLTVYVDYPGAGGVTYRLVTPVDREGPSVRALTPYAELCRVGFRCGGEAAYLPGEGGPGIAVDTALSAGNATGAIAPEGGHGGATDGRTAGRGAADPDDKP